MTEFAVFVIVEQKIVGRTMVAPTITVGLPICFPV